MTKQSKHILIVFFILLIACLPVFSFGEKVTIKGTAPAYKKQELIFYTYSDWVSKKTKILARSHVNDTGYFECKMDIAHTQKIFADLGVYKAYLFVEPGGTYNIVLPEKNPKAKDQQLNPYFEGIPYHIGIKNTNKHRLNYHIYRFLKEYNRTINKNVEKIYASRSIIDSLVITLDTNHTYEHPFFRNFKKYKLGELRSTGRNGSPQIKRELFNDTSLYYYNPAYMELFNKAFHNYLQDFYSSYGAAASKVVNEYQHKDSLSLALQQDTLLRGQTQLKELVMLKGLHDAYYNNSLNKQAIINMVDTLKHTSLNPHHQTIAENIYKKIIRLREGHEPPDFSLYDRDSNLVYLDSLKGSYIYLGFCNSSNYTCIQNYKILDNIYEKHKDHFKILIISTEKDVESMKQYFSRKKHPWKVLHYGNQPEILKEYNVRAMPAYYFIGPDGKLLLSPAPPPSEQIEWAIFKEMRNRGDL